MSFANPIWLWALTTLSVPVLIHLLNLKQGKVIPIGSLRHLRPSNTQRVKRLRLNELVLLLLRSLLIILLVMWLADLQIPASASHRWLLVEENVPRHQNVLSLIDSLKRVGYEEKFFHIGDTITSSLKFSSYWHVMRHLRSKKNEAVVLSASRASGFKGSREPLPENIRWITLPVEDATFVVSAVQSEPGSIVRTGKMQNGNTFFTTERKSLEELAGLPPDTIQIALVTDSVFAKQRRLLLTALSVIQKHTPHLIILDEQPTNSFEKADWLFWLSHKPLPFFASNIMHMCADAKNVLLQHKGPTTWCLSPEVNAQLTAEQHFTLKLMKMLFPAKEEQRIADQLDTRQMSERALWANMTNEQEESFTPDTDSAHRWIALLLVTLMVMERWLSFYRGQ